MLLQATNAAQKGAFEYDAYNDMLLCGPETAKLFGYIIVPGIEKYSLRKDFLVGKAVYEDKKDIDDALSVSKSRSESTKHEQFTYLWKFHIENKVKTIRFKGYIAPTKEGMQIIGMAEDYTEQEKNKTALIKTNEKIQILHSISSHDIRNIITAIYSYADLILEEEVPDNVKADINHLIQSSEDSLSTISTFSHIYRTLGTNLPEWIDLRAVVHDIFESTDLKDISFTNNIGNVDVYVDKHITFVIETLFSLSIKYCQTTSILMYTSISQDILHIIYEDNGVGISEKHKKTIFDFDLTKKDKNALYIAREILSITDISIEEAGTGEGGARFVITVKPGWFRLRE
jgi:signal transduction histidine kinase